MSIGCDCLKQYKLSIDYWGNNLVWGTISSIILHCDNVIYTKYERKYCGICNSICSYGIICKDHEYTRICHGRYESVKTFPCDYPDCSSLYKLNGALINISNLGNAIDIESYTHAGLIYFEDCTVVQREGSTFNLSNGRAISCFANPEGEIAIIDDMGKILPFKFIKYTGLLDKCKIFGNDSIKVSVCKVGFEQVGTITNRQSGKHTKPAARAIDI